MIWVAVWVVLLLVATVGLGLLGRDVWRKGKLLMSEVATASGRIDVAMTPLQKAMDELEETDERREELAVFDNPELLKRDRVLAGKRSRTAKRAPSDRRSNGRHRLDPGTSRS